MITLYRKLKYMYLKKHRYLDPLIQDAIADKTGFIPYEIILYKAEKTKKHLKDFNHYTFNYRGICYDLLEDKLKIISEDDI